MSRPTPPVAGLAARWVRLMLTFGISVAVGMAPLLGYANVPGFKSLLELFPKYPFDFTTQLVAVAGLMMGLTALSVQYFQHERIKESKRRWWFICLGVMLGSCLAVVFITYLFSVEQVGNYNVLIGFGDPICKLCEGMQRSECVAEITVSAKDIDRCFGSASVRLAAMILALLYLAALTLLGALVGLLLTRK